MKIQNIIKALLENQFREQNFETEGSTNGYIFKVAVGSNLPKGGPSGPASGCDRTLPDAAAAAALQWLAVIAPTTSRSLLRSLNTESSG